MLRREAATAGKSYGIGSSFQLPFIQSKRITYIYIINCQLSTYRIMLTVLKKAGGSREDAQWLPNDTRLRSAANSVRVLPPPVKVDK
mmetsp:Transcript_59398/g.69435  ORF Transcript_59398/g.69435 Transcript_59398/m.69435 type:complete len:87 (-) Transcript_59398:359-619(-)